ncbi:hypothetical protein EON80_13005, partial [bacterium]
MALARAANKGQVIQSAFFAQFITETVPGIYDPNGIRHVLSCLKGEVQPEEAWDSFRPDGVHEDAWAALSKEHVLYTAQIRWDYAQQRVLARMLFGVDPKVRSVTTGAGFIEEAFALAVHDSRAIQTHTLEYGVPGSCSRHQYAMLVSINRNHDRDGASVDGQLVIMARRAIETDVAMTGLTAQNAILGITASNVTGDGVFAVSVPGGATTNVTLTIGDTTAQTKAKFEAVPGITTVAVTGTVATASGELHTLQANGASGAATIYDNITVAPGATAASVQALIRAKSGDYSAVTVALISNMVAGLDILTAGMILGTSGGTALGNGTYPDTVDNDTATYIEWGNNTSGYLDLDLQAARYLFGASIRTGPNGGTFRIYGNAAPPAGAAAGGGTQIGADIVIAGNTKQTINFA